MGQEQAFVNMPPQEINGHARSLCPGCGKVLTYGGARCDQCRRITRAVWRAFGGLALLLAVIGVVQFLL